MSNTNNAILEMPAYALSKEIQSKKISCREVMEIYLNHIEKINPAVNAIVALQDRDSLLQQAGEKDALLAKGEIQGWMHGFPQAIKDLEDTVDIPSTYGSPILKDNYPPEDSPMVARMKAAGAIVIGKTNTPEWGYGSQTYNNVYGATGNPYDPDKTSGGSSGGAACALALRMQAVADGSDFMGSLRNPAGYCNVYGYRPSWGRIPSPGADFYLNSCAMRGPMARTVADLALLLATQSGYYAKTPATLADDPNLKALTPDNAHTKLEADVKGRKVAWLGDWDGYLPMEDGVLALCEKTLAEFSSFGVTVESIKPPYDPAKIWEEIWLPFRHFSTITLKAHYDDPEKRKLLKPEAIFEYEGSLKYSAQDLYFAAVKRSEWYLALLKVFEHYDYVAVPTAQVFAFDKTIHWPKEINGKKMDTYHRWMEIVTHWTLAQNPVVVVPAGFNAAGQSMGIQIVGKPRGDFDLLQLAYAYEKQFDFVNRYKPSLYQG